MDRETAIAKLRAHERELRSAGVTSLSVFGSVARGEEDKGSDVDVLVRLSEQAGQGGFDYFSQLDALASRLEAILGQRVDLVAEPVRRKDLRRAIDRDAALAF